LFEGGAALRACARRLAPKPGHKGYFQMTNSLAVIAGACDVAQSGTTTQYPHCFNLLIDSSLLAQFAGVLTGLIFAAIAIVAGGRSGSGDADDPTERSRIGATLVMFLAAFLSLAIATYLFVGAAADVHPYGRATFIAFSASLALVIGLEQLFVGIVRLVEHLALTDATRFAAGLFAYGAVFLIFVYMGITAVDSAGLLKTESHAWVSPMGIGTGVLFVLLVVWIGYLTWTDDVDQLPAPGNQTSTQVSQAEVARKMPAERHTDLLKRLAAASVGSVVIYALAAAYWGERGDNAAFPAMGYFVLMVILFLTTALYCLLIRAYLTSDLFALVSRPRQLAGTTPPPGGAHHQPNASSQVVGET
jgi:hypothetical protein